MGHCSNACRTTGIYGYFWPPSALCSILLHRVLAGALPAGDFPLPGTFLPVTRVLTACGFGCVGKPFWQWLRLATAGQKTEGCANGHIRGCI